MKRLRTEGRERNEGKEECVLSLAMVVEGYLRGAVERAAI